MAITRTGEELTPEAVLETLDELDEAERKEREDADAKAKADAEEAAAKAKAEADAKAKGIPVAQPVAATPATDDAAGVAWDIALDSVKESCPDLDDEDIATARKAAGNSPREFRNIAKRLQDKIKKAKAGAPVKTQDQLKAELVEQVFDGTGAGGDAAVHQRPAQATTEQKFLKAVKTGDSRGIMRGIAQEVKDRKLLGGTEIVE